LLWNRTEFNMATYDQTNPEIIGLAEQKALAKALIQQGMNQNLQGQMVSGRFVGASPLEGLANMLKIYAGQKSIENLSEKEKTIAEGLRQKGVKDIEDVMTIASGRKALPSEQVAGPTYNGVAPTIEYPAVEANPRTAMAKALLSENQNVRSIAPVLAQEAFPKTPEEVAKYKYAQTPEGGGFKGSFNDFQNQMTPYQKAHLGILAANQGQSRVPMGYRMTKEGNLEPIPGGPADQKAQTVDVGRQTVDTLATGLKAQYDILKESGGITSKNEGALSNIPAYLASSGAGQTAGKMFGTANQSARNTIAQSRPLLLQAIAKATGMSSKQMDSNTELQMYLKAATDPSLDYESNVYALEQLQSLYGIGGKAPVVGGGSSNVPSASDIDAEIARRKKK
jgi:hypothetical protein